VKLYLSLILLLPLIGAVANAMFGRFLPRRFAEGLACAMIWGSFASAAGMFAAYHAPVRVELCSWLSAFDLQAPVALFVDPLSLSLCLMITFVCALIHLYSIGYMAGDPDYARFFALLNLFVFAMLLLVLAENLPLLYLGWEGVGFCSYALIGFWYKEEKNATAGRKAFIVTRVGDICLGIAIVWLYQLCGTLSIVEINGLGFLLPVGVITAIGLLILGGAMGKSAQLPLSVWLPDAMAGPTPVSAQIHAATMVTAGVYLLARIFPFIGISPAVQGVIAATGGITAFYAATCALAQRDLKRVLAYSTISQIGYMVLAVGCGAITSATFHLLVHAFFKALLFLAAGCVITALHHEQDIFRMGGLRRTLPMTFWPFAAGAVCLAGIPLTGGFFSKDAILMAVWERGGLFYGGLYILGLVTALLTSIYTFRMLYLVFGGDGLHEKGGSLRLPQVMEKSMFPLALLGLFGGLLNLPGYLGGGLLGRFLAGPTPATHPAPSHMAELGLQGVAALVALAGLAIVHQRYGGDARQERLAEGKVEPTGLTAFLFNGWYLDNLYRFLFIRPFVRLAGFLWERIDEGVIDDSLDRLAALLGWSGGRIGSWTSGRVSLYITSFAAGAAVILGWIAWTVW
jgi:NADH-quinone oxidoreductase subunit L